MLSLEHVEGLVVCFRGDLQPGAKQRSSLCSGPKVREQGSAASPFGQIASTVDQEAAARDGSNPLYVSYTCIAPDSLVTSPSVTSGCPETFGAWRTRGSLSQVRSYLNWCKGRSNREAKANCSCTPLGSVGTSLV